ncbi:MAG: RNA polymerase sigma factor [Chloroflexi bacterium]|nr:RNA polymerase sigma factor [Chloroflexota bacterium]
MPDEILIREASRGDREAFASLAAPRIDQLFATATLILRDRGRAEDAVQEALVRAWRDLRSLRDPGRLDAWLRRLLVNACRDESRRGRRHESNIRLLPDHDRPTTDSSGALADRDAIDRGLARLSTDHRAVIVHHYFLGLSLPEIAGALDIPVGTAKSRLHHARRARREAIGLDGQRSEGHIA